MPYLFWNPLSINFLIVSILTSLVAAYFAIRLYASWQHKQLIRIELFLFITFANAALGVLLQFLSFSLHPHHANFPLPWISISASGAMAGFVLFAFNFQRKQPALSWGNIILVTVLLIQIGIETYIAFARHKLLQVGIVEYRDAWIDIPLAVGFFTAHVFLGERVIASLARDKQQSRLKSILPAIVAILWPPVRISQDGAAARAFFYMALMPLTIGVILVARGYGLIDWRLAEVLTCWFFLLTIASFALVYLNYVPEHSSFKVKLVGVTLTTVLTIICGTAWLVGSVYLEAFEDKHQLTDGTAIRFQPELNGGYSVTRTRYHFDMDFGERIQTSADPQLIPFAFTFFGKSYSAVFPRHAGMVGFEQLPLWRDIQHRFGPQPAIFVVAAELIESGTRGSKAGSGRIDTGMFIRRDEGQVTITWRNLISVFSAKDVYSFQLKLYPNGVLEMVYSDLPDNPASDFYRAHAAPMMTGIVPAFVDRRVSKIRFASDLPFKAAPGEGIVEFKRLEFLGYLDKIYEPIALFVLASSLAVLIVFPRFFTVSLDQPLQKLIQSVRKILDGKLATPIEISFRDEIGYLASSFNEMAKAQSELIHTLEDKVAARTEEVSEYAERNARLEERNHLSNELHDAVSQTLFSANLIADAIPSLMHKDHEQALQALSELKTLNKDALVEMRQLLFELRSQKLSAYTFGQLLEELVKDIGKREQISIVLDVETDAVLPSGIQHTFYRIAQECLANITKHAEAENVRVYFDGLANQAMLSIADDGLGFSPDQVGPGSLGLQIMANRMTKIGGTLEIDSEMGNGTTITAIWIDHEGK